MLLFLTAAARHVSEMIADAASLLALGHQGTVRLPGLDQDQQGHLQPRFLVGRLPRSLARVGAILGVPSCSNASRSSSIRNCRPHGTEISPDACRFLKCFLNAMTQERPIALGIGMSSSYIEQGSEKEGQAADADRDGVDSDPGTTGTVHSAHYSGMNKKQPC